MTRRIERMKACLNGGRRRDEHPQVPISPAELARAAEGATAAGAEALHLHPRDASGRESLAAADVGATVAAVRTACPGTEIGVSTGLWITGGDLHARHAAVAGWTALQGPRRPDFASVNVSEAGWAELAGTLSSAGIATEAGVWSAADARALAAFRPAVPLLRILVEIIGEPADQAASRADEILRVLDATGAPEPRLLHGEEESCWPLIAHAGVLGLAGRIGLEDTVAGPAGQAVTGNAELVRLALAAWRSAAPPGSPRPSRPAGLGCPAGAPAAPPRLP
jgi:uncharacterized protein (DUF849 family)